MRAVECRKPNLCGRYCREVGQVSDDVDVCGVTKKKIEELSDGANMRRCEDLCATEISKQIPIQVHVPLTQAYLVLCVVSSCPLQRKDH